MKKSLLFFAGLLSLIGRSQIGPSFTLTNVSGSNSITCTYPAINYVANGSPNLTYVWASSSTTLNGANVNINLPGTYTVTANDSINLSTQIVVVGINTIAPVSSLTPTLVTITCNSNSAITFTGSSSNSNCTYYFKSSTGGTAVFNNGPALYTPFAPGSYTYVVEDNINGCKTIKNFAVISNTNHPSFNITSPQSFTLGCGTRSVAIVNIVNASSHPIPGGPVSYTLIGPPTSSNYSTGNISTYTLSVPGIWTAIVRDNVNGCDSKVPFSVLQNTTTPNLSVNVPIQVLDCITSSVILNGSSGTPNVSYSWLLAGGSPVAGNTITVNTNTSSPSSTVINQYTLTVQDTGNACKSMSVIPMYQNTFKPNAAISSGGIDSLPCLSQTLVLTNISSTGIPPSTGFPTTMPVIGHLWQGPNPLASAANVSTYLASVAGIYTLTAKDLNNGCTNVAVKTIYGCNMVGLIKNSPNDANISVFPNPNNGLFTLLSNNLKENTKIEIYNTLGVLIKTETVNSEKTNIHLEDVSGGIYIIQVFENDKIIYSSKIIKD